MTTSHKLHFANSQDLGFIPDESVDLVVTSPPYPMIEMWDEVMCQLNPAIGKALGSSPSEAFEMMHGELDKVWRECYRKLKRGGFLCINIGDATRTINKAFSLYPNHSRVIQSCLSLGFTNLPNIIWRKVTNSPNKFMGSGMLPNGAYVTLEHEWILVFRKGGKRPYTTDGEKDARMNSAYFWEERNQWFSDVWDLKGVKQAIVNPASRDRNASFPFALPYRLISMYSQEGDTVLDPFLGLGTTTMAAMAAGRNSIGVEIDPLLGEEIANNITSLHIDSYNKVIFNRLTAHQEFVDQRLASGKEVKYYNHQMQCPVVTMQEQRMALHYLREISYNRATATVACHYEDSPAAAHQLLRSGLFA